MGRTDDFIGTDADDNKGTTTAAIAKAYPLAGGRWGGQRASLCLPLGM